MLDLLKPFFVVLILTFAVFRLVEPIGIRFMDRSDFIRRRNVWLLLTSIGFLSPSFWVFSILAFALLYWAGKREPHPTALYAMLVVCIPPGEMAIPVPFVNQLFSLSPPRIIALALLVPVALRMLRFGTDRPRGTAQVDVLLLLYGLLQLALYAQFESPTNTLRRGFLFFLDVYLLYYVFSRGATSRPALVETVVSLWLACIVQVPVACFETVRGWLMYTGIGERWGIPNFTAWLMRGDALRAQGPAGHSLTLGFMLAIAFGLWLYLGNRLTSKRVLIAVGIGIWIGLISTYSRAPWIVAAFIFTVHALLSAGGKAKAAKSLMVAGVAVVVLSFTPFGSRMVQMLPFVGTQDQGNVEYREELATVSWRLIKEHPWFGNPSALGEMESLRQGQGIIDLVNTFASVALFYGGVGVSLFSASFVYPLGRAFLAARRHKDSDADLSALGISLVACLLGALLMMVTSSFGDAFAITTLMLAGLCSAYTALNASAVKGVDTISPYTRYRPQPLSA